MKVVIRRAVWMLLALSLAASMFAQQVIKLDAAAIERYANSKTPFTLDLGGNRVEVVLTPAPVYGKEGLLVMDVAPDGSVKESVVQEPNITYAGDVTGEDPSTSEVRFAIAGGSLDGYVYSKAGWWFIEPLSNFDPKAGAGQYLVYTPRDFDVAAQPDEIGEAIDEVVDNGPSLDGRIPIIMAADREYLAPGDYRIRQARLINQINGIYRDQLQREFRIAGAITDPHGVFLTHTNAGKLLDDLSAFVRSRGGLSQLHGELTHLTSGKNFDGDVIGKARWGELSVSQQQIPGTTFRNMMVTAHEIGHNFNAFHELADQWCVTSFLGICLDYERSLMWPTFYNDNNPRFSDGTRNPAHNNVKQVDDNMRARGFPRQPWL